MSIPSDTQLVAANMCGFCSQTKDDKSICTVPPLRWKLFEFSTGLTNVQGLTMLETVLVGHESLLSSEVR